MGYWGVNSPYWDSPIVHSAAFSGLLSGIQSHTGLPEPKLESLPPLVGTFSAALGKGPRTLVSPHTSLIFHLSDPSAWS